MSFGDQKDARAHPDPIEKPRTQQYPGLQPGKFIFRPQRRPVLHLCKQEVHSEPKKYIGAPKVVVEHIVRGPH